MAVPKRKMSVSRTHSRRAHDSLRAALLVECPRCTTKIRPHRVCSSCGYYKGKPWIKAAT
ncbi:MAG: 50S ribosomal protein L32 [Planctomycetes bacterium]|nr:50S ribosomal protein L32 [Planctomycetota bacterium]